MRRLAGRENCNYKLWLKLTRWSLVLLLAVGAQAGWSDQQFPDGKAWLNSVSDSVNNISTDQLKSFLQKHPQAELLDVRLMEEVAHQGGTIKGGRRTHVIPRGWLEFRVGETIPDLDTPLIVYCSTNRRSPLAAHTLTQMGYTNVQNYAEGFLVWQEAGLPVNATDEAVGNQLFRRPIKVADGVYSAIGATAPPTYENSGHNNNLSFIISDDGVLVVNAGDNYLLAQALHKEIKKLTDQPVKYVVLENGQGHAMLGMNYWQEQGAIVIAHIDAASEIAEKGESILQRMHVRNRDKAMGTRVSMPDKTFDDELLIDLGTTKVEVRNLGPAHSPGDIVVWLPEKSTVITGDLAFHERLLPVFEYTDTAAWIDTWPALEALQAENVIPGHGHPTTLGEVKEWTIGYLQFMRDQVTALLDNGGSLIEAYKIDQSAYAHLDTFDELAGLNADRIYRSMEFE